ncbi:hypothetical protein CCR75_001210 [Bremia lactucae]|uniref:Uncharacterized protein n=1 Tax=Bremia lactucae TaxID=4779 RepID=A0A976FPZ3_BRELC|nr:hypothetical protein CCR75_001210 [Bremia lactucae]
MARGQAGGAQSSSYKEMKLFLRNRMWRDYLCALVSVGVIVVALFGSAFLQFSTSPDHVYRIEVTDSVLMKRVFHSGEPWVVLCLSPDELLPEVFDKASSRLAGKSFAGVLDCKQKLPTSGKSVLKRYSIRSSVSPTVFTVANGKKPKQVYLDYLQSAIALAKHVTERNKPSMQQVQTSAQLEKRCLSKSNCMLFLRGHRFKRQEKLWIDKLMDKHRLMTFAWLDSTSLRLSLESMLPNAQNDKHRIVFFQRQHDLGQSKKVLAAKAFRGHVFDETSVRKFLVQCAQEKDFTPLKKAVKISRLEKVRQSSQPGHHREYRHANGRHHHGNAERDQEKELKDNDAYYFSQHKSQDHDVEDSSSFDDA